MVTTTTEYYLRLLLLNVQVATPALCETFFSFVGKTTNKRVDDFLKVFENGFKALEKKRIIKKAEFTKLFPSSGKTLVREWDISLLCSVLSHCCTLNGKLYELRDMLFQEAQRNVNNFVQTHRTAINSMKGAEIDDDEYEIVYPADYSDTEYEKWNTHLIMQILIKLCPAKKTSVMKILRNIFIQEVDLKCSSLDINTFLNFYKDQLLDLKIKCKLSKAQFDTLFPAKGADINTWDDHTLGVVLLNTTRTLSKKSFSSMKKIRTIRSDFLAHRGDAEIEFPEFSEKQQELTKAVTKILEEEKLPILEIKEKINDIVDGPLEIRSTIDCLKAYYLKESSQNDMILGALNSIESNVLGAVEAVSRQVDVGFGKMDSKFEEVLKEVRDLKRKIPDSAYTEDAEIRCVDMTFVIKSETVQKKKKAEGIMMNALKQAQQNTTAQILAAFDTMRKIMTEDGKIIIEVKHGSVIVVIKCFSLKALHRLLEYVGSELLQSHLKEAVNSLDNLIGGISEITVAMSYASLVNVCEDIVRYLIHYVNHTSHLKVTIKRPNEDDLQNIVRDFQVGEGVAQLRILSSKLSNYLGEKITIDIVTPAECLSSELQLKESTEGERVYTVNQQQHCSLLPNRFTSPDCMESPTSMRTDSTIIHNETHPMAIFDKTAVYGLFDPSGSSSFGHTSSTDTPSTIKRDGIKGKGGTTGRGRIGSRDHPRKMETKQPAITLSLVQSKSILSPSQLEQDRFKTEIDELKRQKETFRRMLLQTNAAMSESSPPRSRNKGSPHSRSRNSPDKEPLLLNLIKSRSPDDNKSEQIYEPSTSLADMDFETSPHDKLMAMCNTSDNGSSSDSDYDSSDNEDGNASVSSQGKRKADDQEGSSYERTIKRRHVVLDDSKIRIPLEMGWKRQTNIHTYGRRGINGEVLYFTPDGRKMKTIPDVMRYIERNNVTYLGRDQFSFSTKVDVGDFYEARIKDGENGFVKLSESEIKDRLSVTVSRRMKKIEIEKKREKLKLQQMVDNKLNQKQEQQVQSPFGSPILEPILERRGRGSTTYAVDPNIETQLQQQLVTMNQQIKQMVQQARKQQSQERYETLIQKQIQEYFGEQHKMERHRMENDITEKYRLDQIKHKDKAEESAVPSTEVKQRLQDCVLNKKQREHVQSDILGLGDSG